MKINPLKKRLNNNPEEIMEVSKEEFFTVFYQLLAIKNFSLNNSEIKILSELSAGKELSISKNNLPPIFKKLNEKKLMEGKELSETAKLYRDKLLSDVEVVMNFKIVENGTG